MDGGGTQQCVFSRYNLFYAYKKSKISKHVHATAVNCVIVSLLLQQFFLMIFNITRSWEAKETGEGSKEVGVGGEFLSARAIFSITVLAICTFLFVLQVNNIHKSRKYLLINFCKNKVKCNSLHILKIQKTKCRNSSQIVQTRSRFLFFLLS